MERVTCVLCRQTYEQTPAEIAETERTARLLYGRGWARLTVPACADCLVARGIATQPALPLGASS